MNALLEVNGLTKRYGGLTANADIAFDVNEGEIVGIIGPNGAGKSTLFDLITGFQAASFLGDTRSPACGPTASAASAWPARSRSSNHSPTSRSWKTLWSVRSPAHRI
jgi:ABC-type hemin transport system ATPase subunit